jgi:hypothetical protein
MFRRPLPFGKPGFFRFHSVVASVYASPSDLVVSFIFMSAGQNLLGIVQFSSPALPECDAARAVPLGAFEQEVKRLCAEDLTPHGLMLLYRELADSQIYQENTESSVQKDEIAAR